MPLDPLPSHTSNVGRKLQEKIGMALTESLASGDLSLAISKHSIEYNWSVHSQMPLDPLPSHTSNDGPTLPAKLGMALTESLTSGELSLTIRSLAENASGALKQEEDSHTEECSAKLLANEVPCLNNDLERNDQEFDQEPEDGNTLDGTTPVNNSHEDSVEKCSQELNQEGSEVEVSMKSTDHEDAENSSSSLGEPTIALGSTAESISCKIASGEDSQEKCNQASPDTEALVKSTDHEDVENSSSSVGEPRTALDSTMESRSGNTESVKASLEKSAVSESADQPVSTLGKSGKVKGRKRAAIKRFFSGFFA